jgi:hypothetical protein
MEGKNTQYASSTKQQTGTVIWNGTVSMQVVLNAKMEEVNCAERAI